MTAVRGSCLGGAVRFEITGASTPIRRHRGPTHRPPRGEPQAWEDLG
jgi:hypothetical protein